MSEFQRVGHEVPFGETAVQFADVQPIRELSEHMLLLSGEIGKRALSHDGTVTFIASFSNPADQESPSRYVAVRMRWDDDLDYWRIGINLSTFGINFYNDADNRRYSSKRVRYIFEGREDELLAAKKEVRLIDGRATMQIINGEPQTDIAEHRKVYERAVLPEDCEQLTAMLSRTKARAEAA